MRFVSQLVDTVTTAVLGLWGLGCSLFGARLGFPMPSMNEMLVSIPRWLKTSRTLLSRCCYPFIARTFFQRPMALLGCCSPCPTHFLFNEIRYTDIILFRFILIFDHSLTVHYLLSGSHLVCWGGVSLVWRGGVQSLVSSGQPVLVILVLYFGFVAVHKFVPVWAIRFWLKFFIGTSRSGWQLEGLLWSRGLRERRSPEPSGEKLSVNLCY